MAYTLEHKLVLSALVNFEPKKYPLKKKITICYSPFKKVSFFCVSSKHTGAHHPAMCQNFANFH